MQLPSIGSESFLTDPNEQKKIFEYLEHMKQLEDGWKTCIEPIITSSANEFHLEYLHLQVIEHYLKYRYAASDTECQAIIRQLMSFHINRLIISRAEPIYLKNKWASIFASVFVSDFPSKWPQFFNEVFLSNLNSFTIVEFYLRVLMAVDSEVADKEIQRTKVEIDRNTVIKDNMREICIRDLVVSWGQILSQSHQSNPKIASLCLNVIGAYIAWIDVGLIANDQFVPLIVSCLKMDETQEAACDCICSILSKGMEPTLKIQLVQAMDNILQENKIYYIQQESDIDDVIRVAELINCMGTVLIECWQKWIKTAQTSDAALALSMIENKLPFMLQCLNHEDNDVSGSVTDFSHQYVMLLKQLAPLNDSQKVFVKQLLVTVLRKYRLPDDYSHDLEGENEALFIEYRKDIKSILTNITMLDKDLMVETVEELVKSSLNQWKSLSHLDIELAIAMIYFIGEAVPINQGSLFTSNDPKALKLKGMIRLMIECGVSEHKHIAVNLEYFETVCRYDKLFAIEADLVAQVLASFLDSRGIRHESKRVRSRAVYLFSRFVKLQKSVLQDYVDEILSKVEDLLSVSPVYNDNYSHLRVQTQERLITADDQLFLYEATGTLIVFGNFPPDKKKLYMERLVGSLVHKFHEGLTALSTVTNIEERKLLTDFLNNIMAYASRTTKAFSNQLSMNGCMCSDIFLQLLTTFLSSVSNENSVLLDGLRQYLHRMVICLEGELLPYLPGIIQKFLGVASDLKSLQDFLILIQQIISKHKAAIIPHLHNDMITVHQAVWSVLSGSHDLSDESVVRDLMYLRRAYFQVISAIIANNALELLVVSGTETLDKTLESITDTAINCTDPLAQRQCFSIMQKCATCVKSAPELHQNWFDRFMLERATPACFQAPLKSHFDLADAQCLLVIYEIVQCLKRFYDYKGDVYAQYLCDHCLTTLTPQTKQQFVSAMKTTEPKYFQKYLKNFFESLKNR